MANILNLNKDLVNIIMAAGRRIDEIELPYEQMIANYSNDDGWHNYDIDLYRIDSSKYILHRCEEHYGPNEKCIDEYYEICL